MLTKLQIPWAFVVGFDPDEYKRLQDVIPKNIELLPITGDLKLQQDDRTEPQWPLWGRDEYDILDMLQPWLENWQACTPHLRRITLMICTEWIDDNIGEWPPDTRQEFRELGAQTGVQLEIIEQDYQTRLEMAAL